MQTSPLISAGGTEGEILHWCYIGDYYYCAKYAKCLTSPNVKPHQTSLQLSFSTNSRYSLFLASARYHDR